MPTEAQIRANRQNAQKSTGPKTESGKNNSRQNALKHGLTGQAIVQPEGTEAELLQLRIDQWTAHLQPQNPTEEWLVTTAAIASARIDCCVRYETATIDFRLRHLPATRAEQLQKELNNLLLLLPTDAPHVQPKLLNLAPGCRHLIERWTRLRACLTSPNLGYWIRPFLHDLAQLLGRPAYAPLADPELHDVARLILASQPDDRLEPKLALDVLKIEIEKPPTPDQIAALRSQLPTREKAQQALLLFVDHYLNDLNERLEMLEFIEAEDEAQAPDLALFETTPAATRLHRYESALFRQLNQCLTRLERLRSGQEISRRPDAPSTVSAAVRTALRRSTRRTRLPPSDRPSALSREPNEPIPPRTFTPRGVPLTKRTQFPPRSHALHPLQLHRFHGRNPQTPPLQPQNSPPNPPLLAHETRHAATSELPLCAQQPPRC